MKRIIVLFALLLGSIISIAQPVTQRGTSAVTVQDSRLFAEFNFRPPAFPDTIRANQQIGLDSCGALIFSRDINAYYYRACSPKRWVRVASGGSTSDSAYLSYRPLTDSTFLLCRVGGTRCDTIKVNGKGVTQAWLLGGNLNPVSNNLGTTSTTDVVIITNDVARMKIAGNGINRSSAARNRYLMIDTLTRYLFYGDESDTTAWKLAGNSNAIAGSSFVGTTNNVPLEFRIKNVKSGIIDSTNKNVGLGFNTLKRNAPNGVIVPDGKGSYGTYNVAIGHNALSKDTLGYQNVAVGGGALGTLTTRAERNVALGYAAMNQSITPSFEVAIGWGTLARDYYGYANTAVGADISNFLPPNVGDTMAFNTMLGYASAYKKYTGRYNVFVGDSTGALNETGSRNVFIGSKAGKNETGSDKLYISNSNISNPLIKGSFADSTLNVNGKMSISLTSQTPDSSLDVTGGVKLRTIYRSSALTDSMLLVGADGGVVKREVIVPSNTNVTRIISGSAVWDSLLVYSVTKCWYYINGILYSSAPTNVTLATADSSNPRIDVIYCDTLGNVGVITGIPSPDPVKPTVNPLSQIELTHINVNAQGTTPAGVSQRIIYNENVGVPNEWNTSTDVPASGVDFAYTVNPYVGIKSAFAPAYFNSNYSLIFTNNAFVNADTLSELSMYLRQNSAPPAARAGTTMFSIILYKSGVPITKPVLVSDGLYGYSVLTLNSYQHLAVPFSDFLFKNALDKTFDQIQIAIEFLFVPKLGYQFDYITAGAGGTPPAVTSDYWALSGNDNTSFPNAKLGTTSKDQLSIVTDDIERINITNAGVISIPQLQTTTDTLLYKPLVINPINGQVANIGNWGNNTVYTENPIMSRTSGDSNIIYFNADTANAWRGGGGATPTLQQVLDNNHELVNGINLQGTNSGFSFVPYSAGNINSFGTDATYYSIGDNINAMGSSAAREMYYGVNDINAFGNNAGYYYGTNAGNTYSNVNLFGNGAGYTASGNDVNAFGGSAAYNNNGSQINAFGGSAANNNNGSQINAFGNSAAQSNSGNNVNAFGNGAGSSNTYSDVNIFGQNASATENNQIAFSRDGGTYQTRINQPIGYNNFTFDLPSNSGTLLTDAPNDGNLYGRKNNNWQTITSGGTGTVTDISQGYGITASPTNPITVSGTIEVDTVTLSGKYLRLTDSSFMLSPYLRKIDTASLSSRINLKVNISDTNSMLLPYLRKIDTTNRFVNNVTKKNDSTITVFKGSTSTDIVLPRGSAGSSGTVTSVAALTLGTSGTDLNSTVANSTTTPVITLNVPDASATARGVVTTAAQTFAGVKTFNSDIFTNATRVGQGVSTSLGGNPNVIVGRVGILNANTTGYDNTAMGGSGTMAQNTTGFGNSTFGSGSLGANTIGYNNTMVGYSAGARLKTGNNNVAIGANAMGNGGTIVLDSGSNNIAIGQFALGNHENGNNNTIIGFRSFFNSFATGSYNTIIGDSIDAPSSSASNYVMIGDGQGHIRFKDDNTNTILPRLAGTGTRMVTAGTNGELSTQAIPSGGGGVTSIAQGYGITNSPNPIVATGTITVDTATLSGKYFRIVDTANKWVNNISRTIGKDSIIFNIGSTRYAIKDSVGTNPAPVGYYGAFSDTLSQANGGVGVANLMQLRLTDLTNGVSVSSSKIVFENAGIYNLQYSAQFTNADNASEQSVSIWIRKNGVNVDGSTGIIQLPKKGSGLNGETLPSWNFLLSLAAGDSISWYWSSPSTQVSISKFASATSPTRPSTASVVMTVTQQSGIMAGTGITGLGTSGNAQTGATQVLATGTSGTDFTISSSSNTQTFNLPTASASNTGKLSSTDWSTFNSKIGASDTSVFQRKSLAANTIMANNTASPANATAQVFVDKAEAAYTGTILWSSGTAPSGTTNHRYKWSQIGKTVTLSIMLNYGTVGAGNTGVTMALPNDCPTPINWNGWSTGSDIISSSWGFIGPTTSSATTGRALLTNNAANNGYTIIISSSSTSSRVAGFTLTYFTP